MKNSTRQKLIFISLLVAIAYCKAADLDESWNKAVRHINWQQADALSLSKKQINAIPADLDLPLLRVLDLSNNQIGAIPADLTLLQLQMLFLTNNQIDAIPANLNLPQLRFLNLVNNKIGAIPAGLNLLQLQWLDLSNNKIGAIPAGLNLPQLLWLDLSNNQIGAIDLEVLTRFPNLVNLNLSNNPELDSRSIDALKDAALKAHRNITITADNIHEIPEGHDIKG